LLSTSLSSVFSGYSVFSDLNSSVFSILSSLDFSFFGSLSFSLSSLPILGLTLSGTASF
tara:strand:+ start:762 stop:938 length:177 start_codon:yes stop_codon:yes gene_type:complete